MEFIWTVILLLIAIRIIWWAWGPKKPSLPRPGQGLSDSHDAAISIAAVLGVRDGLHGNRRSEVDPDRK